MKQKYTSANTSINSTKLPRIYNLVMNRINKTDDVIDYGCGKFFDNYNLGSSFYGYDPYNRPDENLLNRKYDVAICSNVLNVIMEREQRISLLKNLKSLAPKVFITVYEGNGSGVGKVSKDDCYQLNRKHGDYTEELTEVFGLNGVLWNKKGYFECYRDGGVVA